MSETDDVKNVTVGGFTQEDILRERRHALALKALQGKEISHHMARSNALELLESAGTSNRFAWLPENLAAAYIDRDDENVRLRRALRTARGYATDYRNLAVSEGLGEGDGEDLLPWEGDDEFGGSPYAMEDPEEGEDDE